MTGVIERVWGNEARNGQKYLTVQIDDERYSLWDTKCFDHIQEGLEIQYEFRQRGNFKHLRETVLAKEQERPAYRPNDGGYSDRQAQLSSNQPARLWPRFIWI